MWYRRNASVSIILLLSIGIAGIIPGCGDDLDCLGFDDVSKYFNIIGAEAIHTSGDNFSYKHLDEGETIRLSEYRGVHLYVKGEFYGLEKSSSSFKFSWVPQAMACSPPTIGWAGSEFERLRQLDVTTENDFDALHPAGSNINDVMRVVVGNDLQTIEDFVSSKSDTLIQITDIPYVLKPIKSPDVDSNFIVTMELSLSTGENYSTTSGSIILIP